MSSTAHQRLERPFALPELPLGLFAFLLSFVWEMLQSPFYVGMAEMPHWEGVRMCIIATLGDVLIALVAFWAAALVVGSRAWMLAPERSAVVIYVAAGLVITVVFESFATGPLALWEYGEGMPRLPVLGTGLAPILMWLTLPIATLWLTRRYLWGRAAVASNRS